MQIVVCSYRSSDHWASRAVDSDLRTGRFHNISDAVNFIANIIINDNAYRDLDKSYRETYENTIYVCLNIENKDNLEDYEYEEIVQYEENNIESEIRDKARELIEEDKQKREKLALDKANKEAQDRKAKAQEERRKQYEKLKEEFEK